MSSVSMSAPAGSRCGDRQRCLLQLGGLGRVPAQPVQRAVARHRRQPGARPARDPVAPPCPSAPSRTHPARTPRRDPSRRSSRSAWRRPCPTRAAERLGQRRVPQRRSRRVTGVMLPERPDLDRAEPRPPGACRHVERLVEVGALDDVEAATCSLVSANGPSTSSTSPPRTRTVAESLAGRAGHPSGGRRLSSISLTHASVAAGIAARSCRAEHDRIVGADQHQVLHRCLRCPSSRGTSPPRHPTNGTAPMDTCRPGTRVRSPPQAQRPH